MEKYFDAKGVEYAVGDIVLNTGFGDLWYVREYTDDEKQELNAETDLCLVLNNDPDMYIMDIDAPAGFEIICRPGCEDYNKILAEMNKIAKEQKEWEANLDD